MSRLPDLALACLVAATASTASAAEPPAAGGVDIVFAHDAFTRDQDVAGTIRLRQAFADAGEAQLRWTDCLGRTVLEKREPVAAGSTEIAFRFPAAPGLALANTLAVEVTASAASAKGSAGFIVTPDFAPWDDYQVIMYNSYPDQHQDRLRELGITAGMNQGQGRLLDPTRRETRIWWEHGYRFYAEQILKEIYSQYHRVMGPGKPHEWHLIQAKERYKQDKSKKEPFFRDPCFADPQVRESIRDVMTKVVTLNRPLAPVFYSLADEAGVANLPSAWDFCFDPRSLAEMRTWLKEQYPSLDALNAEWATHFASWDEVTPMTTDETMRERGDDNLSPWADHRTFMEMTFADAVKLGVDAVNAVDPKAYCGLVGCQMPSAFGGYDYWRLAQAMTMIEPYNIGDNRELWRSFSPGSPAVTTSFGYSPQEAWRLWYQLLHGDRGIIIYDEKNSYLDAQGEPTELGRSSGAVYRELTGGICKLLSNCRRVDDPIAIHYSHPSIHAHWMFQARPEGENWIQRSSPEERIRSDFLRLRESFTKLIEDQQLQYDFLAYAQLERGDLAKAPPKLLYLPQSIAMSASECAAVRDYVQRGGVLVADSRCALMDQHCKRLAKGQLDDLFGVTRADQEWKPGARGVKPAGKVDGLALDRPLALATAEPGLRVDPAAKAQALYADAAGVPAVIVRAVGKGRAVYLNLDLTDYHRWRLKPGEDADARALFTALSGLAGVAPTVRVAKAGGGELSGVEIFRFASGDERIVAIHRNPQLRINELGPPEYQSNAAFEQDEDVVVDLGGEEQVYDVRAGKDLGRQAKLALRLKAHEPLILALLAKPAGKASLSAPAKAKRGEAIALAVAIDVPADSGAVRLEVLGPDRKPIPCYARNLATARGKAETTLFLAYSDPAGTYNVTVRDIATGVTAEASVAVE